jgi:dUTP pyrophosphatase
MSLSRIRYSLYGDNGAFTPIRAHQDDACYDLFARSFAESDSPADEKPSLRLAPGRRCLARTGLFLELEPGWEALVRPRSGNALKLGLTVLNAPGTIDAGYRNEVGVILFNAGETEVELKPGMRIAQMALRLIPGHELERIPRSGFDAATERGLGGFGSSGS